MTRKPAIVCALATLLATGAVVVPASADTYAWTDESGAKHVTDRLSAVPEAYRERVVRIGGAPSAAPAPSAGAADRSAPAASAPSAGARGSAGGSSDEIFRFGADPVARSAEPAPPADGASDAQEVPKDNEGHDRQWWQQQMAAALNRQTAAAGTLQRLDAGNVVLTYGRPAERTKHRDELAKARKEAEDADKAVQALKKRARTAEADPSWLVLPGMETTEEKKKP